MCRMQRAVVTLHNRKKGDFDPSLNFKQQQFRSPWILINIELLISGEFQSRYFKIKFRSGFFASHAGRGTFLRHTAQLVVTYYRRLRVRHKKSIIVFYFLLASVINDMIALTAR